jgi:hypothetical protein
VKLEFRPRKSVRQVCLKTIHESGRFAVEATFPIRQMYYRMDKGQCNIPGCPIAVGAIWAYQMSHAFLVVFFAPHGFRHADAYESATTLIRLLRVLHPLVPDFDQTNTDHLQFPAPAELQPVCAPLRCRGSSGKPLSQRENSRKATYTHLPIGLDEGPVRQHRMALSGRTLVFTNRFHDGNPAEND